MEKFKDRWVRREGFGEWYDGGELIHLLYLLSIEQPRTWTSLRDLSGVCYISFLQSLIFSLRSWSCYTISGQNTHICTKHQINWNTTVQTWEKGYPNPTLIASKSKQQQAITTRWHIKGRCSPNRILSMFNALAVSKLSTFFIKNKRLSTFKLSDKLKNGFSRPSCSWFIDQKNAKYCFFYHSPRTAWPTKISVPFWVFQTTCCSMLI